MNREIKFRAWSGDDMYYSEYSKFFGFTGLIFEFVGNNTSCPVMQYTGLNDKWSNEIYEGDIVVKSANGNSYQSMPFEVVWNKAQAGFNIAKGKNHHYEKLGNIYQNPELLKEAAK